MTEQQKMLSGELFNSLDAELSQQRIHAKQLCDKINQTPASAYKQRIQLIQQLFQTEQPCLVEPTFYCDYGYNIQPGRYFYANHSCIILDAAPVTFGDHVLLGPNVQLYTINHPLDPQQRSQGLEYAKPIHIGHHVWIGGGAIVLPGVHIGDNAVIGAGSVVCHDIPANVVAVGNPCRVVKSLP